MKKIYTLTLFCSMAFNSAFAFDVDYVFDPGPIDTNHVEVSAEQIFLSCGQIRIPCLGFFTPTGQQD